MRERDLFHAVLVLAPPGLRVLVGAHGGLDGGFLLVFGLWRGQDDGGDVAVTGCFVNEAAEGFLVEPAGNGDEDGVGQGGFGDFVGLLRVVVRD